MVFFYFLAKKNGMVLGIGGVSRAGKSSLAAYIKESLNKKSCCILDQDDFVLPQEKLPRIKNRIDWEKPETIDLKRLLDNIQELKNVYDLLIVEGIFAFSFSELNEIYDHGFFINISKDCFLSRKRKDHRWGYEPEWYYEHIWNSFHKYGSSLPEGLNIINIHGENPSEYQKALLSLKSINVPVQF